MRIQPWWLRGFRRPSGEGATATTHKCVHPLQVEMSILGRSQSRCSVRGVVLSLCELARTELDAGVGY